MMKRARKVEENAFDVIFLDADLGALITEGVSTCICLLAKGQVMGVPYLAMLHWDGLDYSFDKSASDAKEKAQAEIDDLLFKFSRKIIFKAFGHGIHASGRPSLDEMHFIGGEHASADLSGTELEVETLKMNLKATCEQYFATNATTLYGDQSYLTSDADCLRIVFSADDIKIFHEDDDWTDEFESTEDDNSDEEDLCDTETVRKKPRL